MRILTRYKLKCSVLNRFFLSLGTLLSSCLIRVFLRVQRRDLGDILLGLTNLLQPKTRDFLQGFFEVAKVQNLGNSVRLYFFDFSEHNSKLVICKIGKVDSVHKFYEVLQVHLSELAIYFCVVLIRKCEEQFPEQNFLPFLGGFEG